HHSGLNLSYEVLEGLGKHNDSQTLPDGTHVRWPSLEGQIADLADEITYYSHDLDDGLDADLVSTADLDTLTIWSDAHVLAEREFGSEFHPHHHRGFLIRCIVNREVEDLVVTTARAIAESGVRTVNNIRTHPQRLARFSDDTRRGNAALRKFLYKNLYYNPAVASANARGCGVLEGFFHRLMDDPSLLGRKAASRVASNGLPRSVADYLAGMTDRYCLEEFAKLN
ncbi:MAG: deoxyguanosinetriphosphate triphosphohydrolase, partial [Chthoniobacterales bacterium]